MQSRRSRHGDGPHREGAVISEAVFSGDVAIAGIGATEFSKDSGRSELRLAAEAATAALADAGLAPSDVDGLVTFTMDSTAEIALARELGVGELRFFSQVGYGGGAACAIVQQAAMAVATGIAQVVVCYRALNERSGRRFGQVSRAALQATSAGVDNSWHYPMGLFDAGRDRGDDRPALHARLRRDQRGLRPDHRRRPPPRRRQPEGLVLPATGDARRAPGVAVDRRAAAAAGLLPGERRRRCRGRDRHRAGPGPAAAAGRDPRRRPGQRPRPVHDDQLLPRRAGAAGDGRGGRAALAAGRDRPAGRAGRRSLRPLHAVCSAAAGGAGFLPAW